MSDQTREGLAGELEKRGLMWACTYCNTIYAEYVNGCPRCHMGEPGTATSVVLCKLVKGSEVHEILAALRAKPDPIAEAEREEVEAARDHMDWAHRHRDEMTVTEWQWQVKQRWERLVDARARTDAARAGKPLP